MTAVTDVLRAEVSAARARVTQLRREEEDAATTAERLERQLQQQRRRREELARQINHEQAAIDALTAALDVLAERLPIEPEPEAPPKAPRTVQPGTSLALKILADAETLDRSNLSERTSARAENVRLVLAAADGPVGFEDLARALVAKEPTEAKARTAAQVALTVLVAEGRARCVNAGRDVWTLVPSEMASANLGTMMENFQGKTTRWPHHSAAPKPGTRIVEEPSSYEAGKRR